MKFDAHSSSFVIGISLALFLLVGPVLLTSTFIIMGILAHYHPQDDMLRLYHFDTSSAYDGSQSGTTIDNFAQCVWSVVLIILIITTWSSTTSSNNNDNSNANQVGVDLVYDLHTFLQTWNHSNPDQILNNWKRWVDGDMELVMRDTPQQETNFGVRLLSVTIL
jgi:hypothetical protein